MFMVCTLCLLKWNFQKSCKDMSFVWEIGEISSTLKVKGSEGIDQVWTVEFLWVAPQ